jgi:hypothetical protein
MPSKSHTDSAEREQRIRERAYQLWQARRKESQTTIGTALVSSWKRGPRAFAAAREREPTMGTIFPFLRTGEAVFDPKDIAAMSMALDDVCKALKLDDGAAKEVMASRIIDLARTGERSPTRLRDRVLREAGMAGRVALNE